MSIELVLEGGLTTACSGRRLAPPLLLSVREHRDRASARVDAYHQSGRPLYCEIPVQPWGCEFWPLDQVLEYNKNYLLPEFAPGYLGFATSGGGEVHMFAPSGRIVCLAFVGMSPKEELLVAETWRDFEGMLVNAL